MTGHESAARLVTDGADGPRRTSAKRRDPTRDRPASQMHVCRLERTAAAIATSLRILRAAGEPGQPAAADIATGLALILGARLGQVERLLLAGGAILALDREHAEALADAMVSDFAVASGEGVEAERMRRQWRHFCAGRPYTPPRLTAIEQRRAARIRLDASPRAALAEAWQAASARDRRDLVRRVTGDTP